MISIENWLAFNFHIKQLQIAKHPLPGRVSTSKLEDGEEGAVFVGNCNTTLKSGLI